ncbi:hypothetical protein FRC00_007281 [Tulasnella sp. 408]|nr:hypothetical protein FRC00_007281 [Tulasnella sp. 408]
MFEVPDPPPEFGQDGGKFYRHYDALAQEIDDDMTSGLKEQLDGMLIFAGLFAGVNTAFLALTIPLLSADPADDTNALLNAILMQLAAGRNDTVPTDSILPSSAFSPSHDIFTINALFSLSLAFAIISSFLAVLGRQWLVYYRKRGGGGPDRQRWEQLKRFLGAERWKLEPILDDVLPSLLQIESAVTPVASSRSFSIVDQGLLYVLPEQASSGCPAMAALETDIGFVQFSIFSI